MTLYERNLVSAVNDNPGYCGWLVSIWFINKLPKIKKWVLVKPFVNIMLNDENRIQFILSLDSFSKKYLISMGGI